MKWIFLPNSAIHKQCKMIKVLSATKVYESNRAKEPIKKTQKNVSFVAIYMHSTTVDVQPMFNACKKDHCIESKCPNKDRRASEQRRNISKRSKCNAPRPRVHHLDT